jgi:NAD(P)-dependent dehydrogenase (short-subunit alcohol dehydrogenase family)
MNKVMLVTGGSRGIGAATVRLGAKRGYAVAINYQKRADVAQNLMNEINDGGGKAIIIQANVSVESEIRWTSNWEHSMPSSTMLGSSNLQNHSWK